MKKLSSFLGSLSHKGMVGGAYAVRPQVSEKFKGQAFGHNALCGLSGRLLPVLNHRADRHCSSALTSYDRLSPQGPLSQMANLDPPQGPLST